MADLGDFFDATSIPNFGPEFASLPDFPALNELKSYRQWVGWTWARRETSAGYKWTKPPINAMNGRAANVASSATWCSHERAEKAVDERDLAGVGFVLTERDPFIGIDLDKCRDPNTGTIEQWALDILALAETYAEVSPSETGIRLIARGGLEKATKNDAAHVELYDQGRYVTITGRHVAGTPDVIGEAAQTIDALLARVGEHKAKAEPAPAAAPSQATERTPKTAGSGRDFFRRVNDVALANMEAWVSELFPGARGGQKGYRITSKQLGRNLQEDLSITSQGCVDFGVHDMGDARDGKRTPIDLVLEYGGAPNATDAALWLCDKLHREPADLGWEDQEELARIGAEIAEAMELQHAEQLLAEQQQEDVDAASSLIEVDGSGIPILPPHLLDVPGLVGDIMDWIVRTAEMPQPVLAMGAALTLLGTAMGRRWYGPTQSSTALYVLALAPTGAGKERPRQAILDLLIAANLGSAAGASNFTSSMAIENMVVRNPVTLNRIDEVGAFLKKVLSKRANSFEQEMARVFRELWGINTGLWQSIERAQTSAKIVHSPHVSIYATGVPSEVFEAIGGGDLSNGTINRFLLLPAGRGADDRMPPISDLEPPEHLVSALKRIAAPENDGLVNRWVNPEMTGERVPIPFASADVEAAYRRFKKEITSQLGGGGDFRARTVEMAIRLATIRAFSAGQEAPAVTMEDLRWAADLALWSAQAMERMCAENITENETQGRANKVRIAIRELGGECGHTALLRKLRNTISARDLEQTILLLVEGGFVGVDVKEVGLKRGPRPRTYRLLE